MAQAAKLSWCADFFTWESFARYSSWILGAYCLVSGFSIAASEICIVPLVIYWAALVLRKGQCKLPGLSSYSQQLILPMLTWSMLTVLASLLGIDPIKALLHVATSFIHLLFPFAVARSLLGCEVNMERTIERSRISLLLFCASMCLASFYTLASSAAGYEAPPLIPGPVYASGQLVLIIPMILALWFLPKGDFQGETNGKGQASICPSYSWTALCPLLFLLYIIAGWPQVISPNKSLFIFVASASGLLALLARSVNLLHRAGGLSLKQLLIPQSPAYLLYVSFAVAILFASLVLNLKRGPWLGVALASLVLGCFLSRKLVFSTLFLGFCTLLLPPVRSRLFNAAADFLISGGRKSMWTLGFEIIERFPIGLGFHNSAFMRKLDPSLPYLHRHMHNNFLNVTVEVGFVGLSAYLWWMISAISIGFLFWNSTRDSSSGAIQQIRIILLAVSCALLGWQTAGLVEYNFGTAVIRLIAFFLMGMTLALASVGEKLKQSEP